MRLQLLELINNKIMQYFFRNPTSRIYLRELARQTGLSAPGALKISTLLEKEELIMREEMKAAVFYKAKLDETFFICKRLYNLSSVYSSGLIDALNDFYEIPPCIVLFGSYADGTDIEKSDIDIAIITKSEKEIDITKFEKLLNHKINILTIDLNKASKEFKNNLANGVVLHGSLSIIK